MRIPLALLFFCPCLVSAAQGNAPALYPYPQRLSYEPGDDTLTCEQLEQQLTMLEPLSYSYKRGFYDDPAHGAAIWGTVFSAPVLSYFAYSGVAEYYDHKRMMQTRQRIAVVRQLKANRRCFQ